MAGSSTASSDESNEMPDVPDVPDKIWARIGISNLV